MAQATPELEEQSAEVYGPPTVLVVDDDLDQCTVLTYRLRQLGFEVREAHTGREAEDAIRSDPPKLVLMDVRLPDANGLELTESMSDDPKTSDIPVIVISGAEQANAVRRTRQAGGRYYLRKPYDPNALLLLIRDALEMSGDW